MHLLLGYKKIYLLGIDLNTVGNETHYHGGYGEDVNKMDAKLKDYFISWRVGYLQMKFQTPDVKVWNCSKISALQYIMPYKNPEDVL